MISHSRSSADRFHTLSTLRYTFFSGEPLFGDLIRSWRKLLTATSYVINFYGPMETTMIKSWCRVPDPAPDGVQPIGKAQWDTQLWVVVGAGLELSHGADATMSQL